MSYFHIQDEAFDGAHSITYTIGKWESEQAQRHDFRRPDESVLLEDFLVDASQEARMLRSDVVNALVWTDFVAGVVYLLDDNNQPVRKPEAPSELHTFNWATRQWEDPRTPETEWPLLRAQRSRLLAASDWTQLPDVPLATKDAWATYRQALRDITTQPDPFNITWPPTP